MLHKPGQLPQPVRCLGQLTLPEKCLDQYTAVVPVPGDTIFMLETLRTGDSPVTAAEIKSWTDKDPI